MSRRDKQVPWMGRSVRLVRASVAGVLGLALVDAAVAQQAQSLNGPPVQVIPYASEPGVPTITINPGTPNPFPTGGGSGTGGSGGGNTGDSSALTTLTRNIVGIAGGPERRGSRRQSVRFGGDVRAGERVQPAVRRRRCAGCVPDVPRGVSGRVGGRAGGKSSACISDRSRLCRNERSDNRGDSGSWLPDAGEPAAAERRYFKPYSVGSGSYYNFGPICGRSDSTRASGWPHTPVPVFKPFVMAANGISPGETVGQWQAAVSAKIGNAAGQTVLT